MSPIYYSTRSNRYQLPSGAFRSRRRDSSEDDDPLYAQSSEGRSTERWNFERLGTASLEKPPFVHFDTQWNTAQVLRDDLLCTSHVGRSCEANAPLSEIMKSVFPQKDLWEWNAFDLQTATAALSFRNLTADMLKNLAVGVYNEESQRVGRRFGEINEPPYTIQPPEKDGVYPVLYEVVTTSKSNVFCQAVDPLLYLHGEEHLRVVRFDINAAREVIGEFAFDPTQISAGDLLWVYRLSLTKSLVQRIVDVGRKNPKNGQYPIRSSVDLSNFTTRRYLRDVKKGDHPKTVFQIAEYAMVTPHAEITSRLARATIPAEGSRSSSETVVIEGEMRTGRIDTKILLPLLLSDRNSLVCRVFYRPPRSSIPHFSAPPKDAEAVEQIAKMLKRDRDFLTLMPDRIGFSASEKASNTVQEIVDWKLEMGERLKSTSSPQGSVVLGNDAWREAIEVVKLGETGLRHEAMRRFDRKLHRLTLEIVNRSKTVAIAKIVLELGQDEESHHLKTLAMKDEEEKKRRNILQSQELNNTSVSKEQEGRGRRRGRGGKKKQETEAEKKRREAEEEKKRIKEEQRRRNELLHSWSDKGRRVGLRRNQSDDWAYGSIVKVKLDRSVPSILNDLMLGKPLNIPGGSNGEKAMSTVYREILVRGMEPELLPPLSSSLDSLPATFRRQFLWTDEQREVLARGPSLNLPILNVDAGAGTGKTTAIVGAIEQTLAIHGEGTLIITVAVTNIAVEILVEKMLSIGTTRMKVTRLPGREGAPADLLDQIMACASDKHAPARLKKAAGELRSLTNLLRRLQEGETGELDTANLDQTQHLQQEIERKRDGVTKDLLLHRRPNALALTLDTLLIAMTVEGAVRDYIESAERVFLWMDESSQAPELSLAAFSQLLPTAYQRYVGDWRQLPPQHHHHYNDDAIDAQLAGSVAMTLSRSAHTPTLRMRQCLRMHPALRNIASSLFYSNTLVSSVNERERMLHSSIHLPDRSFPLCIITTGGMERKADVGFSIGNQTQEQVAVALVRKVLEPAYGRDVAILSCYRESVDRIRKDHNVRCTVSTVDSSMGAEFDAVVVLTTRSRREEYEQDESCARKRPRYLSFIEDERRVNVAMTRARRAVFIIGENEVWRRARNWESIYDLADAKGNVLRWPTALEQLKGIKKCFTRS